MPCRDYEDDRNWEADRLREQNDRLSRMLDRSLSAFAKAAPEALEEFAKSGQDGAEVKNWYEAHMKAEAAETARKAAEKALKKAKRAALAKLTPEDRKALGL